MESAVLCTGTVVSGQSSDTLEVLHCCMKHQLHLLQFLACVVLFCVSCILVEPSYFAEILLTQYHHKYSRV